MRSFLHASQVHAVLSLPVTMASEGPAKRDFSMDTNYSAELQPHLQTRRLKKFNWLLINCLATKVTSKATLLEVDFF